MCFTVSDDLQQHPAAAHVELVVAANSCSSECSNVYSKCAHLTLEGQLSYAASLMVIPNHDLQQHQASCCWLESAGVSVVAAQSLVACLPTSQRIQVPKRDSVI